MTAQLRILATTDVHMQMLGHDYVRDVPGLHHGLAGLAELISTARGEARRRGSACLLLDNGDMLQGNALGDDLTRHPVGRDHPVVASLNHLRYDALGLGNHDLDHGLPYLQQFARQLAMPVVSSNLAVPTLAPLRDAALIDCKVPAVGKTPEQVLRIGILSVLPSETAIWNRSALHGVGRVTCPIASVRARLPILRARGADLIILLAHMGIGDTGGACAATVDATALARIPGIDAIITGHTHRRFPGRDHGSGGAVDSAAGTLADCPAVMPGFGASDLAVVDLTLSRTGEGAGTGRHGWHVSAHGSTLLRNSPRLRPDPVVTDLLLARHNMLRRHLAQPIGQTDRTLHNYFSLAMPTSIAALSARGLTRVLQHAVAGTAAAALPVLAAVAAHTAGGRGGPAHYLHIPQGAVLRRHLAGLCPYADEIWGLRVSGADIKRRLEYSARVFTHLRPDAPDQPLTDPDVATFHFDSIYGVTYQIDPCAPPGTRISDLRWQDQPVRADQEFLLATNQFRAAGGGGFDRVPEHDILVRSPVNLEQAMADVFETPPQEAASAGTQGLRIMPWRFAPAPGVQAIFETSPEALLWLDDLAHLSPTALGSTADGFARLRLHF
tara:strand:- start:52179 stop:54011 length:1833 start_codon:yes stop_codon:yes gene_type:complete